MGALPLRTPGQKDVPPAGTDAESKATTGANQLVSYQPLLDDLTAPARFDERLEWVRQSYQRFFDKVLEADALLGRSTFETT
jgi:hypothetical protein